MNLAVCTLFEGDYHYGVGAMANSLYVHGFRGNIYVGYRGEQPPWAVSAVKRPGFWEFCPAKGLTLRFIPLATKSHLTNYKPDFMLDVLTNYAPEIEALQYLDPDVVLDVEFDAILDWVQCGVAVCEDVNSPIAENHPIRVGWRRFFAPHKISLTYRQSAYANGGAVGVRKADIEFIRLWSRMQSLVWPAIGGSDVAGIAGGKKLRGRNGFGNCFTQPDQDALNAALEAWSGPVSMLNRQAMGFAVGKAELPHALGSPKPWRKKYLAAAFAGRPPTLADKRFWRYCTNPIVTYPRSMLFFRRVELQISAAIGRVIRRA